MSGIAALIDFSGRPIDSGAIERMTAAIGYRGPDGIAHWHGGMAALGHCMMHTTAESLEESQPLASEDGDLVLVWDGWLSNPEELRGDLLARGARLRTRCDAELVLRAYEAWGEDCPRHIDGEFAFVIWDGRRRLAYCAQDHIGLRPLHYHWDGKRLAVGSDLAAVLAAPGVEARPNRGMAAEIICNESITRGETIWQGVMRFNRAGWKTFSAEGLRQGEYWAPSHDVRIEYPRDEDYADHYRELLIDCVRRASRTHLPLACEVSGGLDSSAIYCIGHRLLGEGRLQAPGIHGYTLSFAEGTEAFELPYVHSVAEHTGTSIREVKPFSPDLAWVKARGHADRDIAPYPNLAMNVSLGEAFAEDGCRVVLNGEGGDEWVGGKPAYYADNIAEGNWRALMRDLVSDAGIIGLRGTIRRLYQYGLGHFVPQSLRDLRRKFLLPRGPGPFDGAFWVVPEIDALLASRRAAVDRNPFMRIPSLSRRSMYMVLTDPWSEIAFAMATRQFARSGYETRSPMSSRKFIEFAFATPESIRFRGNTRKFTHSRAMAGILPDDVAQRRTKADFGVAFSHMLDTMDRLLVDELPSEVSGFLDPEGIAKLYDAYRRWPADDKPIWELWGTFGCLEAYRQAGIGGTT